jgi:hypothetical protein
MLLLQLAGGILSGVLLIQLDKVVTHLRTATPSVQAGQELFVMPRMAAWVALWFALVAVVVAAGTLFLAVAVFKETAQMTLPKALGLGGLGLALSCLPGYLSYKIFKVGSFRARVDGRGVLVYRSGVYRFMAWAELKTVAVRARAKQLVLEGGAEGPLHLEFQVAGFQRLLALVLKRLPPVKAPAPPLQFGRADFRGLERLRRGPKRIRSVKVETTAVKLGTLAGTVVLKWDELESAVIEDYQDHLTVYLGTNIRAKDGRSFRVDAALADPFVLAPALQDAIKAPTLF